MPRMRIRDNALWAKHVEDEPRLAARIVSLRQNESIVLLVDGIPVRFAKMRDGRDGRPTPGLRPADAEAKRVWDSLQQRRGETVHVALLEGAEDPDLAPLQALMWEWGSPEDAAAYDRL